MIRRLGVGDPGGIFMNETKMAVPQGGRSSVAAARPAGTARPASGGLLRSADGKNAFVPMNIGKYQATDLLAEGGQGKVYLAYDTVLDPKKKERVVIKELKIRKKDARERFKREVKILKRKLAGKRK